MSASLDVITCLAFAGVLFPLGTWGRRHAEDLVAPAILGDDREHRIAVLRRGGLTCQVVAVILAGVAFWLTTLG